MAAWQVDFYLVPRRDIPAAVAALTPSELDGTNWWAAVPFPPDYQQRLDNVAPRGRATSPQLETWGRDDGNRIDVASDGERVQSVVVCVDVRRLDSKFGAALIDFVRNSGLSSSGAMV